MAVVDPVTINEWFEEVVAVEKKLNKLVWFG